MGRVARYRRRGARTGAGVGFELLLAEGPWARTVGLLAERGLDDGIGLLIPQCSSVHTIGMRFAIDVAFLRWPPPPGEGATVLSVSEALPPWRTARLRRRGSGLRRDEVGALELAAGEAARLGIVVGGEIVVPG